MTSELTTYWMSKTEYNIQAFKDKLKTIPYPLSGLTLELIGKKRITDTDADAVFILYLGAGLTLDSGDDSIVIADVSSADTSTLPRSRTTVVYCELLATSPERQTLGKFEIPVEWSLKEAEGS